MNGIKTGEIGRDGSHKFKVVDKRGCEIQIEYLEMPKATMWVQENRISRANNQLENDLALQ